MTAPKQYRVIQWATGHVGRQAVRGVVAHPELELVGCWVHSDEKVGRDAGELCGTERLGVLSRLVGGILAAFNAALLLSYLLSWVERDLGQGGTLDEGYIRDGHRDAAIGANVALVDASDVAPVHANHHAAHTAVGNEYVRPAAEDGHG